LSDIAISTLIGFRLTDRR